jgi:hypothetical protein
LDHFLQIDYSVSSNIIFVFIGCSGSLSSELNQDAADRYTARSTTVIGADGRPITRIIFEPRATQPQPPAGPPPQTPPPPTSDSERDE